MEWALMCIEGAKKTPVTLLTLVIFGREKAVGFDFESLKVQVESRFYFQKSRKFFKIFGKVEV